MLDFDILSIAVFGFIYVFFIIIFKFFKHKNFSCLFILTLFYIYLVMVINYTQFPIIFDDVYVETFKGYSADYNLVPLISLTKDDLITSLLNVILFLPFGFLYFIISRFSYKKTMFIGFCVSLFVEIMQLIIAASTKVYFRITDVNDIIFNVLGVFFGIIAYQVFNFVVTKIMMKLKISTNPLIEYVIKKNSEAQCH